MMLLGRPANVMPPIEDRRAMRRFDMRLPASVKLGNNSALEVQTETQNVSARGVFFYLDHRLEEGRSIEITISFPSHVNLTDNVRVRFMARVIRVEEAKEPAPFTLGVAAVIEEYEFLRAQAIAEVEGSGVLS
jgi:PilZ domain-containing protein